MCLLVLRELLEVATIQHAATFYWISLYHRTTRKNTPSKQKVVVRICTGNFIFRFSIYFLFRFSYNTKFCFAFCSSTTSFIYKHTFIPIFSFCIYCLHIHLVVICIHTCKWLPYNTFDSCHTNTDITTG